MQDFGTKANDTAGPSGQLSADEFNNLATELENAVLRSGQALSGASVLQMAISLFLHGTKSQTFQDSGVANAYVATPVSGLNGVAIPADYAAMNGSIVLFSAANANSGASTLNIGQTTGTLLGAKAIVDQTGAALTTGSIAAGTYVQLRYDSSIGAGSWVLLPSSRPIASTAQAQSWTNNTAVLTALRLAEAMQGANQSLTTSGYQKIPGGWIVQWGVTAPAAAGDVVTTVPIAFPAQFLNVLLTQDYTVGSGSIGYAGALPTSLSQFTWRGSLAGNAFRFIAVGR